MDWLDSVLAVAGTLLGFLFSERAEKRRRRWEQAQRRGDLLRDSYAAWIDEMEAWVHAYATNSGKAQSTDPHCQTRILLLETDPAVRRLVEEIPRTLPTFGTDEYQELEIEAHTNPDGTDWPPFRQKMDKLKAHLAKRFSEQET